MNDQQAKALAIDGTVGGGGVAVAAWTYFLGHPIESTAGMLGIALLVLRILIAWKEYRRP